MKIIDLVRGTKKLRGKITTVNTKEVKDFQLKYFRNKSQIRMTGKIRGTTEDKIHRPTVRFFNVKFSDDKKEGWIKAKGKKYYFRPVSKNYNVALGCTCSDWNFTWAFWTKKKDKTAVEPGYEQKPYEATGERPERNPKHVPGMCKHIVGLLNVAKDKNIYAK